MTKLRKRSLYEYIPHNFCLSIIVLGKAILKFLMHHMIHIHIFCLVFSSFTLIWLHHVRCPKVFRRSPLKACKTFYLDRFLFRLAGSWKLTLVQIDSTDVVTIRPNLRLVFHGCSYFGSRTIAPEEKCPPPQN